MNITVLDFYVAPITSESDSLTVPSYGTPRVLAGASQVQVAYNKSSQKIYESGRVIYNRSHIADAKVTLSTHTMSLEDKKELFFSLQAADGEYIEGTDADTPQNVAVGWPVLMDDGKYLCTWFYDCIAEPSDENYQTSNESGPQIEADSIAFSCIKRPGDRALRRTAICNDMSEVAEFFAAVDSDPGR